MNKYVVFRELLDYVAHIADVTDADMNYCGNMICIHGDTEDHTIIFEVTIKNKEVNTNGN